MTPNPLDTETGPEAGARMPDGGAPGDDDIDLQAYWRALVGRRWLILGATGLCVLIALILTLLATPIFRADTTLQINRDTVNVVQVQGFQPVESLNDQTFYQTQYDLLKSHSLARRVVVAMDLQHDAAFQGLLRPSPLARLLGFLHGASARKPSPTDQLRADADALLHMVSVQPVLNSKLVTVSVDTPDPRLSARIANVYADQFIRSNLDRRMAASGYAKQYLQDRLQQLKLRLEDSDKELVAFAQKHQIVNISDRQSLVGQQLEQLNVALAQAEQDRYKAEAKWRQLQGAPADQIAQVLGDPVIEKLQQAYAEDQAKYQDQLRIYKPAFPAMLQLHAKLDEIHRQ
ncbi:exopolysaccharide biosynthesis protein, partial [mine drainage metagenome]